MSTPVAAHLSRSSSPDFQGRRERVYRPVHRKSDSELFYTRRELMAISAPWAENIKMRLALLSCPEIVARKPQDSTERPIMQQRERQHHDHDENEERRRGGSSGSRRRDDSRRRGEGPRGEDERRRERALERTGGRGEEVVRKGPGGEPVTRGRSSERIIVVADRRTTQVRAARQEQQPSRDPSRCRSSNNRACSRSSVMARRESRVRERQAQNGWR